jgi:serine phosphatase RsbU (regulator of sigma subunit)
VAERPLTVAAASRPHPGEAVNGDAWIVVPHEGGCLLAVIDGLGHGPEAAAAAHAASDVLAAAPHLAPAEALQACHSALRGTRGAAISVVQIVPASQRLVYAGVGNVEARLRLADGWQRPIAYRGIVGAVMPRVRSFELTLAPDWLLVLHTDGVSARFDLDQLAPEVRDNPQPLADAILAGWARQTDDATVVVARAVRARE